jgi:hypothetical protein
MSGDSTIPGVALTLVREDQLSFSALTDDDGFFQLAAPAGKYAVTVTSPGWAIESINNDVVPNKGVHFINLVAAQDDVGQPDLLAPLVDIRIRHNDIQNMGLSGIGMSSPARDDVIVVNSTLRAATVNRLAPFGNPIELLAIDTNHIHECVHNPFDTDLLAEAAERGVGGISLGLCDNVTITNNRIENNGRSHINPIVGISALWAEQIQITDNLITDNGPFSPTTTGDLQDGRRGGIVAFVGSFGLDELFADKTDNVLTGRPAARIHDNIVQQPAGQTLSLMAVGPVSICNNYLNAELTGPSALQRLAGNLLVLNVGGTLSRTNGNTLIAGNQIRLGASNDSFTSQLVWTIDDLGYTDNQSDALTRGVQLNDNVSFFVHAYLIGATLRADSSRFKEPIEDGRESFIASLLSLSTVLNNTTDNQGNHCIFAVSSNASRPAVATGNQVIDTTLCQQLGDGVRPSVNNFGIRARAFEG